MPVFLPNSIDLESAVLDIHARLICVQTAGQICSANPECDPIELSEKLYAFIMADTSESFKGLLISSKKF